MKSAIVYCRISTKAQEEKTSLDSQEDACIKQAASLGYTVGRITKEIFTGSELYDRPQLARDRADIKAGKFQALIAYSTDRLSRDPIHLAVIAEECERSGAEMIFVSEPLDTSMEGALIRYVKGFAAKIELAKIRERCNRGKRQRAREGKIHNAGGELYGYRRNKQLSVREIYEPEAAIVRRIFQLVAVEGRAVREVARILREEGIPPPSVGKRVYADNRNPRWGKGIVYRILRNPAYKGEGIAWQWKRVARGLRIERRDASERIKLPDGVVPALVLPALWESAQVKLNANKGEVSRNIKRPYLLRGRLFCSVCGNRMYADVEKGCRAYRCSSREKVMGKCGSARVSAEKCEIWAWEKVADVIRDPKLIERELKRLKKDNSQSRLVEQLKSAQRELERIERGQQRLVKRLREATDEGLCSVIEKEIIQAEQEQKTVRSLIADIEHRLTTEHRAKLSFQAIGDYCMQVQSRLSTFDFDERRKTLEAFGAKVFANGRLWRLDLNLAGVLDTSY